LKNFVLHVSLANIQFKSLPIFLPANIY